MTGSGTQTGLARCYRHPMRETGVRCVRCDRPICPDCMRPASVGFMCPDDVRLGNATVRAPRTAVGAKVATDQRPFVTWSLIAANVAVFLATFASTNTGIVHNQGGGLLNAWSLAPAAVIQHHQWYRVITSAFLHWNLLHLAANMIALWSIGPAMERLLGRVRFLVLYLLAALGGSAIVLVTANLYDGRQGATAGASGAIFGLFGAALVLYRQLGIALTGLAAVIAINLVVTVTVPAISWQAHVGGLLAGAVIGVGLGGLPRRGRPPRRPPPWLQAATLTTVLVVEIVLFAVADVRG